MDEVFVKLQLTTVYGKLAGEPSAPLILCIHGFSQRNGWHTWLPLMEPLAAAGYCVVSIDMPGWGESPKLDGPPLNGERAAKVVIDIINGLQKTEAVLMGKSWGGGVAFTTAMLYPERISKLIVTAPAYRDIDGLESLQQPVLMAWSKDDPVIPYIMAQEYLEHVPAIRLETYKGGGHSAAPKNAELFAPVAVDFLREN